MDELEAISQLHDMIGAGTPPALSYDHIRWALSRSLVPDSEGRWPTQDGYVQTWDLEWAAAELSDLRALRAAQTGDREAVTRIESEGSSFTVQVERTDWATVAHQWRQRSQIGQAIGYGQAVGALAVPSGTAPYIHASEVL